MSMASIGIRASKRLPPPPGVPDNALPLVTPKFGWIQFEFSTNTSGFISFQNWDKGGGIGINRAGSGASTTSRFRTTGTILGLLPPGKTVYAYFGGFSGTGSSGNGNGSVSLIAVGGISNQILTQSGSLTRSFGNTLLYSTVITATNVSRLELTLTLASTASLYTTKNYFGYIGVA